MSGNSQKIYDAVGESYKVRRSENSQGEGIQHVRLDVGSGTTESLISSANPIPIANYSGLVPESYDYISLSYTGTDLTGVVYKTGGSGGTTVATLTLGYTGTDLTSVTKT